MTEMLREQLSALADDELEHARIDLLLRHYGANSELRACWSSYHLIGETMRRGRTAHAAARVAERVTAELDRHPGQPATGSSPRPRWRKVWQSAGAVAVAASVGVVAVLAVRTNAPETPVAAHMASTPARTSQARFNTNVNTKAVSNVRWDQGSPRVRRQLNEYLFDHNEGVTTLGRRDMLSYVNMTAYYAGSSASGMTHRQANNGDRHE